MTHNHPDLSTRLRGLLRLFRFELPFAAGICTLLGEFLALGAFPTLRQIALGFISVFCISATALILNDYFDLETDRVNAPHRPLPSGMATPRDVVWLSIAVAAVGLLAAWLISLSALAVGLLLWVVGFLYNWRLKRSGIWGNLMVGFSVGMTFIYGGIAVGRPWNGIAWFFGVIAFLIDLGEEIAGDAMDLEGDRLAGSRSLALRLGREAALRISAGIFLLVILISSLPFLLGWLGWIYLLPITLMDTVILYFTFKLLVDDRTDFQRKYLRWIYLSGAAAILVILLMRMVL